MDTWMLGGPISARYNRSKSGWFNGYCFKNWMQILVIPYFRHNDNDTPKLLIGDNFACHLSIDVIEICEANNIRMIFLPPNSTHLLQSHDLAVYGPMKSVWRKLITE
nr:MFS-type transporter clz9-like [Hydra vulgaris]